MKKILLLISLFAFLTLTGLNAQTSSNASENQRVSVKVDGLACPFCAYGLEKKIKDIEGAAEVNIDLKSGLLTFQMQEGKAVSEEAIRKKVKDAGFTPREISFSKSSLKTKENE